MIPVIRLIFPGLNFIHNYRVGRTGGGVGLYLADYLFAESLFVEINRTKGKNVMIGVIHRPPDCKLRDFIFEQEQLVSAISQENKTVFLMGDWNLNMMNHSFHQATDYPPY